MKKIINKVFLGMFLIGSVLLLINIYGLFQPLGNDEIYSETHVLHKNDIDKNAQALLKEVLSEKNITDRKEYIKKVVPAVNKSIAHYWWEEGRIKYNLTIPIYKNFILWFKQFTDARHYKFYEFCDYKKALERKVGLCSQHAITVCGILNEKKIPCKIVALSGHVVAMAEVEPEKYWILDADYDVIVPLHIDEIEEDPSVIIPYYKDKIAYSNYALSQVENNNGENTDVNVITLEKLVSIFGKKGNFIIDGVEKYCGKKFSCEERAAYLIWIIPLLLILPFLLSKIKKLVNT